MLRHLLDILCAYHIDILFSWIRQIIHDRLFIIAYTLKQLMFFSTFMTTIASIWQSLHYNILPNHTYGCQGCCNGMVVKDVVTFLTTITLQHSWQPLHSTFMTTIAFNIHDNPCIQHSWQPLHSTFMTTIALQYPWRPLHYNILYNHQITTYLTTIAFNIPVNHYITTSL